MAEEVYETLIIGGGPAGLSAALYLARYDRRVALFDIGHGRSTWHQVNHNYLGFPGGIATRTLRELGYQQLSAYPYVQIREHKIETLQRRKEGFVAIGQAGEWIGRTVILCTGVLDHYPHFGGWEDYVGRSMFWCITCDGYESQGKRVVVIGNTNEAVAEAMQLSRFTDKLTLLANSHECFITPFFEQRLSRAKIPLIHDKIEQVDGKDGYFEALYIQGGRCIPLERLFCQQGATPQTKLAEDIGVSLNEPGYIVVDSEQRTTVPCIYAAGDVTRLHSHQVSTAVHEGAQAASAANYDLYPPELKDV